MVVPRLAWVWKNPLRVPSMLVIGELSEILLHVGPTSLVPVPQVDRLANGWTTSDPRHKLRINVFQYNDTTRVVLELLVTILVSIAVIGPSSRWFRLHLIPADGRGDGTSAPIPPSSTGSCGCWNWGVAPTPDG